MSTCFRADALRDYAFDELAGAERADMEQHVAACAECAAELDQLRVTTAALRILPDREIPQRIAFVSDKVLRPSGLARFLNGYLGFASAALLAAAIMVNAYRKPATVVHETRTIVQAADVTKQVDDAVARAVARVREDDARILAAADVKHEEEHRALMDAVTVLQDRQNANTLMASAAEGGQ